MEMKSLMLVRDLRGWLRSIGSDDTYNDGNDVVETRKKKNRLLETR